VADTKARALKALYGEDDLGRVQSWYFLRLTPILAAESGDDIASEKIADSARTTKTMLATVIQASDAITNALSNITASATDKATIIATRNALQGQVTAIVSAQNALSSATSQLQQATTSIASLDAQITKYALYAPFSGVVTALDAKRGEIANPGIVAVSLMNTSRFEIEATIAEADIAKLKVGNQATVKLDAYGSGVSFQARIVRIDPAGKIIEGVATYKVTLQFTSTDNRILAGLTADIDIHSDQHDHVVFIPTRNIITKDGNKFVKILVQNQNVDARFANMTVVLENESERVIEIPVTIGLRGSDGRTEIISGIRDGDVIVAD
jgi:RND family efflux transporter MFP subunit